MAARTKPCGKCGRLHVCVSRPKVPCCTGHLSRDRGDRAKGDPCGQPAMAGQDVCRSHGGKAPQNLAKAAERVERERAEQEIIKLAAKFTDPVDGDDRDPAEIVSEQIRYQYRFVRWLRTRVEALGLGEWIWGQTKDKIGGDDGGSTYEAKPHAWVVLYREESRELTKLCLDAVKAGFEERRVRLAEQDAEIWVRMMDGLLTDLGHDPEDPKTAAIVERHLRAV